MGKYFDSEGKEVEAFTQDELTAKVTERETALKTEYETAINNLKSEHQTALTTAVEEAKKGAGNKGASDSNDDVIKALQEQVKALSEGKVNDKKEALLKDLAGDDKDLRTKLEHEYAQFNAEDTSEAAIETRMLKAFNLVNPEAKADTVRAAVSSMAASRGRDTSGQGATEKTEEQKALANKFGISEEDEKKYGAQADAVISGTDTK